MRVVRFFYALLVAIFAFAGFAIADQARGNWGSSSGTGATPAPTAPPTHIQTWAYYHQFNENTATTATQANNWLTYCEGTVPNSPVDCANNPAHAIMYVNMSEAFIKNTGTSTDMPWHQSLSSAGGRSCPNTGGSAFSANGDETWFEHASGTSAAAANRIAALTTSSTTNDTYIWFLNRGSTTLQNYIESVLDNCTLTDGTTPLDNFYGVFADNTEYQLTAGGADIGLWNQTTENIGSSGGGTYASGSCGTLYGGTTCTISSKLAASRSATVECSTDTCYESSGIVSLFQSLQHASSGIYSGANWNIFFNGNQNNDLTPLTVSNARGVTFENDIVNAGSILSASNIESVIDAAATVAANTTKGALFLNTDTGTSAQNAIGTQGHQLELRLIHGIEWLVFNDNLVDWSNLLDNPPSGQGTGVWPIDFLYPTQPVQTMAAATPANCGVSGATGGSCTGGGTHDATMCVAGTAPNCVFRREFAHCYWQPNYTWSATGQIDAGACGMIVNLTGSTQTISSSWFTQWASYNHVIAMCTPNASYFTNPTSTTSVCTTAASGGDVGSSGTGQGPGVLDFTTAKASVTSIFDRDAVFFTAQ